MGAAPSKLVFGRHTKPTLEELQELILEYLASDDYKTDPNQYLSQISSHGYSSLEEFIARIPSSPRNDEIVYRHMLTYRETAIQIGWRFVVTNNPRRRGVLDRPIEQLPNGNCATLKMDSAPRQSLVFKMVIYVLYLLYPIHYILTKLFGRFRTRSPPSCFKLEELLLEKTHLLAYLNCQTSPAEMLQSLDNPCADNPLNERQIDNILSDLMTSDEEEPFPNEEGGNDVIEPEAPLTSKDEGAQQGHPINAMEDNVVPCPNTTPSEVAPLPTDPMLNNISAAAKNAKSKGPLGKHKGIEGAYNSCYMDSLLFSMFYTTTAFDFLLEKKAGDNKYRKKTRRLLRQKIIAPLRENHFCDYESVMELRTHLSSKNEDLLGAFMDAEEIIYLLCEEVLGENQFVQYAGVDDDGWGDMMHLMSIDAADTCKIITVQRNVETSFAFNGDIKLANVPTPAFILGMPRSNRELIHYDAVIPNTEISMVDLLEPAKCRHCSDPATWEIQSPPREMNAAPTSHMCDTCVLTAWENVKSEEVKVVSRQNMRLRAIITIRGVHFTAFVRTTKVASDKVTRKKRKVEGTTWYFFDSMAGSYPEVKVVPKLHNWLDDICRNPDQFYTSKIPPLAKRSMTDGHLCIYEPIYYDDDDSLTRI